MNIKRSKPLLGLAASALFAAASTAAVPGEQKAAVPPPAEKAAPGGQAGYGVKLGAFFNEQHKLDARRSFTKLYAKAKDCPQGLERKTNVCASPWDTRYWAVGQSLQPSLAVYPVPEPVVAKLPPVPQGYQYVRVADDILLVSSGTKLVVDMIEKVTS